MKEPEIQKIIVKFLNKEANLNELEKLEKWLKNHEDSPVFNRFVEVEYLTTRCMEEYDINKAKELINVRLKKANRRKKLIVFKRVSVAASILLLVGLSYFQFNKQQPIINETTVAVNKTLPGSNKAILTLENGNEIALEKGKIYDSGDVVSNGEELYYDNKKNTNKVGKIKYNYLTIPRGGQFFVELSDGTKVWLNSESKLKYPVAFQENKARKVELVYGEAYFDVSSSIKNNGSSFKVYTKGQEVNVLGTQFNIKAYNEDSFIATTLVEGTVMVQKGEIEKILKPNQQSKIDYHSNDIAVLEINALEEVSWINGLFTFNEVSLEDMMKSISRWYDVQILFEQAKHKQFVFTGILERSKNIDELLKIVEATSEGEIIFEIKDKTIIIK